MVLCRDITEQRRAEELLRASQHQLAEAQRIAEVGSWDWDLATDELALSDELCRMFGLAAGHQAGDDQGVAALIHPADLERVKAELARIRERPGSPFALEHRIVRTDGDVRTVLARGEGVVDEDGRVVRFIGTDQDITERRRADAERRRLLAPGLRGPGGPGPAAGRRPARRARPEPGRDRVQAGAGPAAPRGQRLARGRRAALAGHQGPVGRGDQPAPDHRPAASPGAGRGRPGGRPARGGQVGLQPGRPRLLRGHLGAGRAARPGGGDGPVPGRPAGAGQRGRPRRGDPRPGRDRVRRPRA